MIISERIFKILSEKKISQKSFAEQTGIAQSTISDWKTKKTNPAADKLMIICDVLDVSPYELLSGADDSNYAPVEYVVVNKASEDYRMLEMIQNMDDSAKKRVLGYIEALQELK